MMVNDQPRNGLAPPCRILEIISPAGFEHYFDEVAAGVGSPDDYEARYGTKVDLDGTRRVCEQHGLTFRLDGID
jgi:hypothetical protein